MARTVNTGTDPHALADPAVDLVRTWLLRAQENQRKNTQKNPAEDRLAAVLQDPNGLEFTVGFVDRVVRTEDTKAAAKALQDIAKLTPQSMPAADRAQIQAGTVLSGVLPSVVVPAARTRLRQMVGHMVVDARPGPFGKSVKALRLHGHRLNINLLGEEVLGEDEAKKHLADAEGLLRREDVDYVSLKVSSVVPQLSHWGFDRTAERVVERLLPLYETAATKGMGTMFINLDMEVYSDLELTLEVFQRLLDKPQLKNLEAGIVVQAYLPDALSAVERLSEWSARRVADGGAQIKVRLVKGANLAMENVDAEMHGWPLATMESKQATDTNYKRVLSWLFHPERMRGMRLGVAGHNLFDIAFAHLLAAERGVTDRIEFEMLQGMATNQSDAVSEDVGQLLLYVPAVKPAEFDVAVSYLVRRLEENSANENFMSGIFDLGPDNWVFQREEARFRAALADLEDDPQALDPRRVQDRRAETAGETPTIPLDEPFRNEPDTDVSVPANQKWAEGIAERIGDPQWYESLAVPELLRDVEENSGDAVEAVNDVVATAKAAGQRWAATPARERAEILNRAGDILAARRGHLMAVAGAETGKVLEQSDPEVSEAVDFCRYYARRALELAAVDGGDFVPHAVTVVTPPWNFPLAIPTGTTVAPLATGSAVIHKPSPESRRCSTAMCEALWEAGVPRDVLQLVAPVEGEAGQQLISHPDVERVVLTGAYETAQLFASWDPERPLTAETSGKNALVITPSADRDQAVWDLVSSAFGHAGQKCSAASLGILVGSVATSERFRRQLVDAASSMVVDWPVNLQASVGPTVEQPGDKLLRALTELGPGEEWLIEPKQLDDTGRLWRPGIRTGVKPGSFFHLTECFGPVLGLMAAEDLDHAVELQNATDYGLTAGIHSLDADEILRWVDTVQAGNLYVNRGITGAIVQRQPFGGWKRSSVGLGAKAGGPNYLATLGRWTRAGFTSTSTDRGAAGAWVLDPRVHRALDSVTPLVSDEDLVWLRRAAQSDQSEWQREFGQVKDPTALLSEANLFRYRPRTVVVRA
ncbi:bifunctional proline dehydrogenase/L-glutamate gamma-semialdehyde dehydrogenase, partial [Kocuria sp.]|uniref:bifunctional proline dehydrogenase/L-glutamate gamma-semialdehyde dehydrogenase n=1 Tax=Kocuria sp. TaxID=1871328 RepID=UPI0025C03C83